MAGTSYLYIDNITWKQHPILTGPCMIQVQAGDEALVHFGVLPNPLTPEVYEGVMHQHIANGEPYRYTGAEEIWIRTHANNVAGMTMYGKVACSPLVNV